MSLQSKLARYAKEEPRINPAAKLRNITDAMQEAAQAILVVDECRRSGNVSEAITTCIAERRQHRNDRAAPTHPPRMRIGSHLHSKALIGYFGPSALLRIESRSPRNWRATRGSVALRLASGGSTLAMASSSSAALARFRR